MSNDDPDFVTMNISLPRELRDQVHEQLDYGDARSEFVRKALRHYLECDNANRTNKVTA